MRKANTGIGIIGVFFAIFLFFALRGCAMEYHQEDINNFCIEKGFSYGGEIYRNTLISCYTFRNETTEDYMYSEFEKWKKEHNEVGK